MPYLLPRYFSDNFSSCNNSPVWLAGQIYKAINTDQTRDCSILVQIDQFEYFPHVLLRYGLTLDRPESGPARCPHSIHHLLGCKVKQEKNGYKTFYHKLLKIQNPVTLRSVLTKQLRNLLILLWWMNKLILYFKVQELVVAPLPTPTWSRSLEMLRRKSKTSLTYTSPSASLSILSNISVYSSYKKTYRYIHLAWKEKIPDFPHLDAIPQQNPSYLSDYWRPLSRT